MSWIECVVNKNYEIYTKYPHQIRKKCNARIVSESTNNYGYIQLSLNRKIYKKHRIVAIQFISNPNNLSDVDHINHNKIDNRIENLRWVLTSDNCKNKASHKGVVYEYCNKLPDGCIPIKIYRGIEFENIFYHRESDTCYFYNEINYRKMIYHNGSINCKYITVTDINNVSRGICIEAWLREECNK